MVSECKYYIYVFISLSLSLSLSLSPLVTQQYSTLSERYQSLIAADNLQYDKHQYEVVTQLEQLQHDLKNYAPTSSSTQSNILQKVNKRYNTSIMYFSPFILYISINLFNCDPSMQRPRHHKKFGGGLKCDLIFFTTMPKKITMN